MCKFEYDKRSQGASAQVEMHSSSPTSPIHTLKTTLSGALSEFPTFDLHSSRSPCALQKAAVQLPAGLQKEAVVPAAASARHSAASPICPGIGLASKKAKKSIQNVQLGIVLRATRGDVWGRQNLLSQH